MTRDDPDSMISTAVARRRMLLGAAALLAVAPVAGGVSSSTSADAGQPSCAGQSGPIEQPAEPTDDAFVERAFEMRRRAIDAGDQAYGAVIVRNRIIIGQSWSRVVLDHDPTGHAEISAIRDAARRLSNADLSGAIMYSSSRPCPMCEAAAYWAGIGGMVHGRGGVSAGSPRLCR